MPLSRLVSFFVSETKPEAYNPRLSFSPHLPPPAPTTTTTTTNSPQTSIIGPQGVLYSHAYCITHPCSNQTPVSLFQVRTPLRSTPSTLPVQHTVGWSLRTARVKIRSLEQQHSTTLINVKLLKSQTVNLVDEKLRIYRL